MEENLKFPGLGKMKVLANRAKNKIKGKISEKNRTRASNLLGSVKRRASDAAKRAKTAAKGAGDAASKAGGLILGRGGVLDIIGNNSGGSQNLGQPKVW